MLIAGCGFELDIECLSYFIMRAKLVQTEDNGKRNAKKISLKYVFSLILSAALEVKARTHGTGPCTSEQPEESVIKKGSVSLLITDLSDFSDS